MQSDNVIKMLTAFKKSFSWVVKILLLTEASSVSKTLGVSIDHLTLKTRLKRISENSEELRRSIKLKNKRS